MNQVYYIESSPECGHVAPSPVFGKEYLRVCGVELQEYKQNG